MILLALLIGLGTTRDALDLERRGDLRAAQEGYRSVLAAGFDRNAFAGLERVSRALGDLPTFLRACQDLVGRHPDEVEIWFGRAQAEAALGMTEDARRTLEHVFRLDSTSTPRIVGLLENMHRPRDAIEFIRRARRRMNDNEYLALRLVPLHESLGQYGPALGEIVGILNRNPQLAERFRASLTGYPAAVRRRMTLRRLADIRTPALRSRLRAWVYASLGDYERARREYIRAGAVRELPALGELARRAGAAEEAARLYLAGGDTLGAAECLRQGGRTDEALRLLAGQSGAGARLAVADAKAARGDLAGALEAYQELARTDPGAAVSTGLVQTRCRLGDLDGARRDLGARPADSESLLFWGAKVYFYAGLSDSVAAYRRQLAAAYRASPLLNDVLEYELLMTRHPDLAAYRAAAWELERGDLTAALDRTRRMVAGDTLADWALLLLARIERARHAPHQALAALAELVRRGSPDGLVPRALYERTLVYAEDLRDTRAAQASARELIANWPKSTYRYLVRGLVSD